MVEFCIGIGVLLLVLYFAVELGRVLFSYNTLTKSVRTGARYMSVNGFDDASNVDLAAKSAETKNLIVAGNITGGVPVLPGFSSGDITISQVSPSGISNPYVRVLASYDYTPLFSSFTLSGGGLVNFNLTMSAATTMRIIR